MKKKYTFALAGVLAVVSTLGTGCSFGKKYHKVNAPVYRFGETTEYVEEQKEVERKVYVEGIREYRVQPGDTLSKISRTFNVSVDELAEFNHIENPNTIKVGMSLQIPPSSMIESDRSYFSKDENRITHEVEAGETLWGISRLYGVEVEILKEVNKLDNTALTEGQIIQIPLQ